MIIMPSSNYCKIVKMIIKKEPEKIAHMFSPNSWKNPIHTYAIDNGCFKKFNENLYFEILDKSKKFHEPLFVVCPDVVGCNDRTLALWRYYYPLLKPYKYKIAFVAQDGCIPRNIPNKADWIFIGGTTKWKHENIKNFIGIKPVHVGRVNSYWLLEYCEKIGVQSVDGSGWFRGRGKQYYTFLRWFGIDDDNQMKIF